MTTYLIGYFAVGVVLFVALLAVNRLVQPNTEGGSLTPGGADVGRATHRWDLMDDVLVPALGTAFVVAAWPVVAYWKVREWIPDKDPNGNAETRAFTVTRDHLIQAATVEEIERMEKVFDPLGAVPDLPFGHLHGAWQRFKADLQPEDALWTFSADWTDDWGWQEHLTGYVIVTAEGTGPYFLTSRRGPLASAPNV